MSERHELPKETVYAEAFLYYRMETIPTICDSHRLLAALNRSILPMCHGLDKIRLNLCRVKTLPQNDDARLILVVPATKGIDAKQIKKDLLVAIQKDQSFDGEYSLKVVIEEKVVAEKSLADRLMSFLFRDQKASQVVQYLDYTFLKRMATDSVSSIAVAATKTIVRRNPKIDKNMASAYEALLCTMDGEGEIVSMYWVVKIDETIRRDLSQEGICIYEN
jgi:hypothetical protein